MPLLRISNISLGAGSITNNMLQTNAVSTVKIQDANVSNIKISPNVVFVGSYVGIPVGTTSDRPTNAANGQLRYNQTLNQFEGYVAGNWGSIGGGAKGGVGNSIFYENDSNVTVNYTLQTGKNAVSAGPITIDTGVVVTIPPGSTWTVV